MWVAGGKPVRPKNHGQQFPPHLDVKDVEARRGTMVLRSLDPLLIVGYNTEQRHYEIWGPSLSAGGWIPLVVCMGDDGKPFRKNVPWPLIFQAFWRAQRQTRSTADLVNEHNERMVEESRRNSSEPFRDAMRFSHRAIVGEREGWGRARGKEVYEAWARQTRGEKPAPVGQKIFVANERERTVADALRNARTQAGR